MFGDTMEGPMARRTPQLVDRTPPLRRWMELCAQRKELRLPGAVIAGLVALYGYEMRIATLHRGSIPKDILWFKSERTGNSYALSVNERRWRIEIREARVDSAVKYQIDGDTDLYDLDKVFLNL